MLAKIYDRLSEDSTYLTLPSQQMSKCNASISNTKGSNSRKRVRNKKDQVENTLKIPSNIGNINLEKLNQCISTLKLPPLPKIILQAPPTPEAPKESQTLKSIREKVEEYVIAFSDMEQEFTSKIDKICNLLSIEKPAEAGTPTWKLPSTLSENDMTTIASVLAQVNNWDTQPK